MPEEFIEFANDLYYRIERDGQVTIAGPKTPIIFNVKLEDGSLLSGGVSRDGQLFGERLVSEHGGRERRQIRWHDGPSPNPEPDFEIDFEDQPKPKPRTTLSSKKPEEREPKREARPLEPKARRLQEREDNLLALREAAEALEQKTALITDLEFDKARLQEESDRAKAEANLAREDVARLRVELSRVRLEDRKQLESAVQKATEAAESKQQKRRWQICTAPTSELPADNLETRVLELIDDRDQKLHYLAVTTAPRYTSEKDLGNWIKDLNAKLDKLLGSGQVAPLLLPSGLGFQVFELVPGVSGASKSDSKEPDQENQF